MSSLPFLGDKTLMFLQLDSIKLSSTALDTSPPPQHVVLDSRLLSKALPAFSYVSKPLEAFETLQDSLD